MSIKWMTRVWDEATSLDGTPLLVLLCIADHAQDETGEAWPSIGRIAARVRVTERAVYRALQTIEEAGWIERVARPGQSNVYRLVEPVTPDASVTPDKSSPLTPASPTPDASVTPPLTPASPRTVIEPPSEPQAAAEVPVQGSGSSASRVRDGLPVVLQRKLLDLGINDPDQQQQWTQAWASASSVEWPEWAMMEAANYPEEHLMLHLLAQQEQRRTPSPSRWLRFFIEDRGKRIATIAEAREAAARGEETPQEREDRQNRTLPPANWGITTTEEQTGDDQ